LSLCFRIRYKQTGNGEQKPNFFFHKACIGLQ